MSEWISVKEKLPPKADIYLVYSQWPEAEPFRCTSGYTKKKGFAVNYVTHWQPLPEPPATK